MREIIPTRSPLQNPGRFGPSSKVEPASPHALPLPRSTRFRFAILQRALRDRLIRGIDASTENRGRRTPLRRLSRRRNLPYQYPTKKLGAEDAESTGSLLMGTRARHGGGRKKPDRHGFWGGAVFAGFHEAPRFRCRSRNSLWPSKLSAPIFRQPTFVQQSLLPFPRP